MASLVQRVAVQARETFARKTTAGVLNSQIQKLKDLVHDLTATDVCVGPEFLHEADVHRFENGQPPVTYVHLWEDHVFSLGIFVLRKGACLPLHDHPGMRGMLKILFGTVNIATFSDCEEQSVPYEVTKHLKPWHLPRVRVVKSHPVREVTQASEPCILSPDENNLHRISAVDGPAAFLDILAPPYDHESGIRECHYYKELPVTNGLDDLLHRGANTAAEHISLTYLLEIPQPREFWCDAKDYKGPPIDPYKHYT